MLLILIKKDNLRKLQLYEYNIIKNEQSIVDH